MSDSLQGKGSSGPAEASVAQATKPGRNCPFCAEPILAAAIKCKHCGSRLRGKGEATIGKAEILGVIALFIPVGAAFLAWFWLSNMSLFNDPSSKLYCIAALTVLLTAILIAIEANTLGAGAETDKAPNGKKRQGPGFWFLFSILLWVLAFPLWMYRRSKYGLKNLWLSAVLIDIACVAVFSVMAVSLENRKAEIRHNLENTQKQIEKAQQDFQRASEKIQKQLRSLKY